MDTLPIDCLATIVEHLTDADDYTLFALLSKLHRAASETHRNYLRLNGPRSRYVKTFALDSEAAEKALLIANIIVDYRISDRRITSDLLLFGSIFNNIHHYDDLPLESKIPGIPNLGTFTDKLILAIQQFIGHRCSLFFTSSYPEIRFELRIDSGRRNRGAIHVTMSDVIYQHVGENDPTSTICHAHLRYTGILKWETLATDILDSSRIGFMDTSIAEDDSIDPGLQ
jgi:hypothetical protein